MCDNQQPRPLEWGKTINLITLLPNFTHVLRNIFINCSVKYDNQLIINILIMKKHMLIFVFTVLLLNFSCLTACDSNSNKENIANNEN